MVNHIHDLLDRFRGHGSRGVTAAIAELLDQPLSRDPPRSVAKRRFDRGPMLLPAGSANRDDSSLGPVVEAAARALGNGKSRSILEAVLREVLQLHLAVHERFATQNGMLLAAAAGLSGRDAFQRFAPWAQLAGCEDFNASMVAEAQAKDDGAGSLDEGVDVVTGRPGLELDVIQ